jgi:HEPN domain-containing protein
MTNIDLADSYVLKATSRLKILPVLHQDEDWSDVVREAQEIVELATKAMLRRAGIDPPKWHDVSTVILTHLENFPPAHHASLRHACEIARLLAKEREQAFYGDEDAIPTEHYTRGQSEAAIEQARLVVELCRSIVTPTA